DGTTTVLEGTQGFTDTYSVKLTRAPVAGETVNVTLTADAPFQSQVQLSQTSLTFNSSNWMNPQTITITAVSNDGAEDRMLVPIRHHIASTGGTNPLYVNLPDQVLKVAVIDGDSAGVFVRESNGSTSVVAGTAPRSDNYFVRQTKAPAVGETETLPFRTDGQILLSSPNPLFPHLVAPPIPTYPLTFSSGNGRQEVKMFVSFNPAVT